MRRLLIGSLATLALLVTLPAAPAAAQVSGHTLGSWNRVATDHFLFVFPDELSEWTLHMARRMESVHEAVVEMVGYAPEDRVTVLVDDPGNVSNGSMVPGPLLYMWPTPPNPRSMIGENRGWGEILAVHEFAHAAHLTRPSRNRLERLRTLLLPIPVTAIMRTAPRWSAEGYATYVEGRLTGSGRPHGVWRPAVLRTWALEGQLPTYGQISGTSGFYGGAMAYLMGSAYLEWLVEREGGDEEVLPNLWRRMTARQKRSFEGAFSGVFGAPPAELYGEFTVDVTEGALAVRDAVEAAGGVIDGELFQRLTWYAGDPAVSPDGERLAIHLTSRDGPSRLVVMSTTPDTLTKKARERYEEIFEEDPEDVEPVQRRPRTQKPEATLSADLGAPYTTPAWMPDGEGILVVRADIERNGRVRPDLFLWSWDDGDLRRVTEGQAIREAAPAPDGSWAVGVQCLHAMCNIVRIELDDGAVTPLTDTDPLRPYYHPRVSPDGGTIVAGVQVDGEWRLVAMDADGSNERYIGPDDGAARFDAEFLDDGRLAVTSTLGGIHDIEILDPVTDEITPLTRVIGSAVAPTAAVAPSDTVDGATDIFFLSLHSRGWELRRVARDAAPATPIVRTDVTAFPAASVPVEPGDTFPPADIGEVRPYGLGPRFRILLPMFHLTPDGYGGGFGLGGTDPIGKLSWQLQGVYGADRAPAGGSLRLRYRGFRPWLHVEGFWTRDPFHATGGAGLPAIDAGPRPVPEEGFFGALGAVELNSRSFRTSQSLRTGGSAGQFETIDANRVLGFGEYAIEFRQGPGHWELEESLKAHGSLGRTGSLDWQRWLVTGRVAFQGDDKGLMVTGTYGQTDAPAASVEAFTIGGAAPLIHDDAVASQLISMPALQAGQLRGDNVRTVMADLELGLPISTFFWAGDIEGDGQQWFRVWGSQLDQETPPIPLARIPAARFQLGLARLLDGPDEDEWRAWMAVSFAP